MTTHLTSWSKMSFQKKSKATASVGNPSPKALARSKSNRVTKSEVKVDPDNNNSQESLEQERDKKLDMESKSLVESSVSFCLSFDKKTQSREVDFFCSSDSNFPTVVGANFH